MAQETAIVNGTLTAAAGSTDFTVSGFGTPTAAIVIASNAYSGGNPVNDACMSVGFWDGTNQRCMANFIANGNTTSDTSRYAFTDRIACIGAANQGVAANYSCSAITNGIRLTLQTDNTANERYCTVILIKGVSASVFTMQPNTTQNGTQESPTFAFEPKALFATCIGFNAATTAGAAASVLSFGFSLNDNAGGSGTHGAMLYGSVDNASTTIVNQIVFNNRCTGQAYNNALAWSGEITAWDTDSFTFTTRDGGSGSDYIYGLVLGGADVDVDGGVDTHPTSGTKQVTTSNTPETVLTGLCHTDAVNTLDSSGSASTIGSGIAASANEYSFSQSDVDNAGISQSKSKYTSGGFELLDGAGNTIYAGSTALNTNDFTLSYTTHPPTSARYFWWVSFGAGAAPTGWTGTIGGVTDPASVGGVSVENIDNIGGI